MSVVGVCERTVLTSWDTEDAVGASCGVLYGV